MRREDLDDTATIPAQGKPGFAAEQRETLAKVYRLLLSLKHKRRGSREKQARPAAVLPQGELRQASDSEALSE
jgi:hypothetical protein